MNMFNGKGELNAYSLKEAMETIAKYASILQENQPSSFALSGQPSVSNEQRDELVARALLTQDGKVALAQAMANPIR